MDACSVSDVQPVIAVGGVHDGVCIMVYVRHFLFCDRLYQYGVCHRILPQNRNILLSTVVAKPKYTTVYCSEKCVAESQQLLILWQDPPHNFVGPLKLQHG